MRSIFRILAILSLGILIVAMLLQFVATGIEYFSERGRLAIIPWRTLIESGEIVFLDRYRLHPILIAIWAGILPFLWFLLTLPPRGKVWGSHCPHCNYVLRATPDRCPECGTRRAQRDHDS